MRTLSLWKHLGFCIIPLALSLGLAGCSLLGGGDDDPPKKNENIKFVNPGAAYKKIHVTSADHVWQSISTGNTIAVNSVCQKYTDVSIENLQKNIVAGIEKLKILSESDIMFDGRAATRTTAEGMTDGIPIKIDLLIYKKNNCNFDLTYIARKETFENERKVFEQFLQGFTAP